MAFREDRLLELIERKRPRVTQGEVAQAVGVSAPTMSQYLSGKREPGKPTLERLASYFGVTTDYLLGMGSDYSEKWATGEEIYPPEAFEVGIDLPILGEVRCGPNGVMFNDVIGRQKVESRRVEHDLRNYFWLRARGDSMVMEGIRDGSLVLVHRQEQVDDGDIALVALDEEVATIKRIRHADNKLILIPANPSYREEIVPVDEARILGRVEYSTVEHKR